MIFKRLQHIIYVLVCLTVLHKNSALVGAVGVPSPYDPRFEAKVPGHSRTTSCGDTSNLAVHQGLVNGEIFQVYHWNNTVEGLRREGYQISDITMYGDAIFNFTYSKGSFRRSKGFESVSVVLVVGGGPATEQRAFYMALLGEKNSTTGKIKWLCDGTVINRYWVLSAAHCFADSHSTPNLTRLGEFNWETDTNDEFFGQFVPVDFDIERVVIHPEFGGFARYHDLVLIKLSRPFPIFAQNILPICLPFGEETNRNLMDVPVTLCGWGATEYDASLGPKNGILQEVNLTVFEISKCQENYAPLFDFRVKWPDGMTGRDVLCVGWEEGGKDACKGDSGAPLAYKGGKFSDQYYLAGIVSGGYGCGLADYPGLYIPINSERYLTWIKEIAFAGMSGIFN